MSSLRVCVVCPRTGVRSETFIRRHVNEYFGQAACIAWDPPHDATWIPTGPSLVVNAPQHGWRRVAAGIRHRMPGRRGSVWENRVLRFLRRHGITTVIGEYLDASHALIPICRRAGIRLLVHGHGHDVSRALRAERWRQAYRDYNAVPAVLVPSEHARRALIEVGVSEHVVRVKPYGVEVPASPLQHPPNAPVECVAVGRMVGKKAPILLLDSFRRACARHADLHLSYVGDGPLLAAAHHYVDAFALQSRVTLLGPQDHARVLELMAAADIFLQHSVVDPITGDEEGVPVAILEAAARAVPIVSTRHAGIPEAVEHGVSGYLVAEGDVQGMADAIVTLAASPDRRAAMGFAAWRVANERYSTTVERHTLMQVLTA